MKLELSRQIFEICSNIKFHEKPSSGSRVVPCGQMGGPTDMTKLIVAFRDSANAPKNRPPYQKRDIVYYKIQRSLESRTVNEHILRYDMCIVNTLRTGGVI